ncbi:hypothetical protein K469DRAFT_713511 [Zopfia rhizophila CBS 207.26]|uniref:Uncharacterized protein n=1 Tax=Zopfia rhizophila CBS 207.26 TaxID=1314779 RepID=A0A6A6DAY8_9PEZI|nr:hypothetical protein K469DRAFT_704371 [Zopfia rhizophila CBS 207.26]KAF2181447.1 hypothetical protein K469DRAFT_713511 [Zopfia rhizophila CBS 207.26]
MSHYGIPDPYGRSNEYYIDHYVCPWEVTRKEIVGHWPWDELVAEENWYQDIIMPAFQQYRSNMAPISPEDAPFGLSAIMDKLCLTNDPSDPTVMYGESYSSSEEFNFYFEGEPGWDTDDEVEAANAADDMIKIIEGDW